MVKIDSIVEFLDTHLRRHGLSEVSAVEAARLLDRAGLLNDSQAKPGKPLRDKLRKGLLPHAYQVSGKGSEWRIPQSGIYEAKLSVADSKSVVSHSQERSDSTSPVDEYEKVRARYRPSVVNVLLIGESRPKQGTFFYRGDSNLFRHTKYVFEKLLGRRFQSVTEFLEYFRDTGYFLDDLCLQPINKLSSREKDAARGEAVDDLARRIKKIRPRVVVCVMKAIEDHVRKAVENSDIVLSSGFHCVPFPAQGNQPRFERELLQILMRLHPRSTS